MNVASVSELSSYFESRFEVLKTSLLLHVCAGKNADEPAELRDTLKDIQNTLNNLRNVVEDEKQDIKQAQDVLSSLKAERARLEYIQDNIPSRLPSQLKQAETKDKGKVTDDGGTAGADGKTPAAKSAGRSAPPLPTIEYLTVEQFSSVPQYMRGRMTQNQVNRFIDEINRLLAARYTLLRRGRAKNTGKNHKLWTQCKREESSDTKGKHFFTEDDFIRFGGSQLSKSSRQMLVVLRHCQRTRMLNGPGAVVRHLLV